jgi:LEA14-like dessication related protein
MSKVTVAYLTLLTAFGLWYIPGILTMLKLTYSFSGFSLVSIRENYIDFQVNLDVTNPTRNSLIVNNFDLTVIMDGVVISEMTTVNIAIPNNATTSIPALVRITPEKLGATLWQSLIQNNLNTSVLTFKGIARVNGRPYPFIIETTVGELT